MGRNVIIRLARIHGIIGPLLVLPAIQAPMKQTMAAFVDANENCELHRTQEQQQRNARLPVQRKRHALPVHARVLLIACLCRWCAALSRGHPI